MASQMLFQLAILLLGIGGIIVSGYLHYKKKTAVEGMVCPMDGSCEDVITSKYSKFLGFDVEIFGILYYSIITVAYLIFILTPQAAPTWFVFGVLMSSISAVLFSAYLTYIQGVRLKEWCTWCLVSATFTLGIILAAVPAATVDLTLLMSQFMPLLTWMSVLGAAAGLGTAIAFCALYLQYLANFKLSDIQADSLNTLVQLTWAFLAVVVVSGIGMAVGDHTLLTDQAFLASGIVTAAIILNDGFYSLYLAEKMGDINFEHQVDRGLKKISFAMSSFSVVSWTALLSFKILEPTMELDLLVGLYLGLALIAASGGFLLEDIVERRANDSLPDWSPLH